jgi:hypothetical protein
VTEVDPDPNDQGRPQLGGHDAPDAGDPTHGGRDGEIGEAPSVAADEPDETSGGYPVGGGSVDPGSDS